MLVSVKQNFAALSECKQAGKGKLSFWPDTLFNPSWQSAHVWLSFAAAVDVVAGSAITMTTCRTTYQIVRLLWKSYLNLKSNKIKVLKIDCVLISFVSDHGVKMSLKVSRKQPSQASVLSIISDNGHFGHNPLPIKQNSRWTLYPFGYFKYVLCQKACDTILLSLLKKTILG